MENTLFLLALHRVPHNFFRNVSIWYTLKFLDFYFGAPWQNPPLVKATWNWDGIGTFFRESFSRVADKAGNTWEVGISSVKKELSSFNFGGAHLRGTRRNSSIYSKRSLKRKWRAVKIWILSIKVTQPNDQITGYWRLNEESPLLNDFEFY